MGNKIIRCNAELCNGKDLSMKYIIYQIEDIENVSYAFRNWDAAKSKLKFEDYKKVYYGIDDEKIESKALLEKLFEEFNIDYPEDFMGHSLSVSDIVMLTDGNRYDYYYCDTFGWVDITKDIKEMKQYG